MAAGGYLGASPGRQTVGCEALVAAGAAVPLTADAVAPPPAADLAAGAGDPAAGAVGLGGGGADPQTVSAVRVCTLSSLVAGQRATHTSTWTARVACTVQPSRRVLGIERKVTFPPVPKRRVHTGNAGTAAQTGALAMGGGP